MSTSGKGVVCVEDHRIEFDISHEIRLFTPFQCLHRDKNYVGHGVGLATVKQSMLWHQGYVAAHTHAEMDANIVLVSVFSRWATVRQEMEPAVIDTGGKA